MTADKVRVGVVGLGYWGPNLARNFDRLPGAELAYCCDLDEANLAKARSLYPNAVVTDDSTQLLADETLDAIVVATSVPTHYALGKKVARGRQAHLHREAHRAQGGRRRGPAGDGRGQGRQAHGRSPARVPPGGAQAQGARRRRQPRQGLLRLRQPPQPGQGAHRRERPLELRARTTSRCSTSSSARSPRRSARAASATCRTASRTWCSATSSTRAASSATCT